MCIYFIGCVNSSFWSFQSSLGQILSFNLTFTFFFTVVTIYLGLCLYDEDVGKRGLYAVIAFYVGELCVLLFELYLILSKRNKEKRTSQVNNGNRDA